MVAPYRYLLIVGVVFLFLALFNSVDAIEPPSIVADMASSNSQVESIAVFIDPQITKPSIIVSINATDAIDSKVPVSAAAYSYGSSSNALSVVSNLHWKNNKLEITPSFIDTSNFQGHYVTVLAPLRPPVHQQVFNVTAEVTGLDTAGAKYHAVAQTNIKFFPNLAEKLSVDFHTRDDSSVAFNVSLHNVLSEASGLTLSFGFQSLGLRLENPTNNLICSNGATYTIANHPAINFDPQFKVEIGDNLQFDCPGLVFVAPVGEVDLTNIVSYMYSDNAPYPGINAYIPVAEAKHNSKIVIIAAIAVAAIVLFAVILVVVLKSRKSSSIDDAYRPLNASNDY